ncbi:GNAT family N-acetyltransferase [uncultured Eubacterium sp.]|uniref:GNAT family N-acetyltransferase n=1 Tax=uncultured Eubacterium sp. TaxID=165185 RepID=UPI0025923AB5|nr:GNAT family N-acetyltransferase [uncultured Eubacterium sp.]
MDLIVLIGSGAVGKMTVGQELMKITDFRLFHNHMMIEPVIEIFGKFNGAVVSKLRETIMDEFLKTKYQGMIFTFMWAFDMKEDWDYIASVARKFEETGGTVYYVELVADRAVRLERNKTENRLRNKASKRDLAISEDRIIREETKYRIVSNEGEIPFANYMKIDNTNLEPDVVAKMIKDNFNLPDVSTTELENKVILEEVREDEVEQLHSLQVDSFMPLYEKYHDDLSPAIESVGRVREKVNDENRTFYFIVKDGARVGGVCTSYGRVNNDNGFTIDKNVVYISPIFVHPKYQNLHIGQVAIKKLFDMYNGVKIWKLWTILEEESNCHFYEKCGFVKTGEVQKIKDDMSLVEYER